MSQTDFEQVVQLAKRNFLETDEPVYSVSINYPNAYPVRYDPYGLGAAAFEAIMETEPALLRRSPIEVVRKKMMIEAELEREIPDWEDTYISRCIAAIALNNYGGPNIAFSPN